MMRIVALACLSVCLGASWAEQASPKPAYEATYDTKKHRNAVLAEVRKLTFGHVTQVYEGVLAEDNVVVRGEGFRIGYTNQDFCTE